MPSALDQLATVRSRSAPVAGDDGVQDSVHSRVQVWGRVRERARVDDEDSPGTLTPLPCRSRAQTRSRSPAPSFTRARASGPPAPQLALSTPRQVELRRHRQGYGLTHPAHGFAVPETWAW